MKFSEKYQIKKKNADVLGYNHQGHGLNLTSFF